MYIPFIVTFTLLHCDNGDNVTDGDNCLKSDEYRNHKDKDNVVSVYYQSQNLQSVARSKI